MYDALSELLNIDVKGLGRYFEERVLLQRVERPFVIRLDGVRFGRELSGFKWPRDRVVHEALLKASKALMELYSSDYAYVVSDELNIFVTKTNPYGGRVFKIVSEASGLASAIATRELGKVLYFDARVIKLSDDCGDLLNYIKYRVRVGLNNYHVELAQRRGLIPLNNTPHLPEVLRILGINTTWEALGTMLVKVPVKLSKEVGGRVVEYVRRRIVEVNPLEFINRHGC